LTFKRNQQALQVAGLRGLFNLAFSGQLSAVSFQQSAFS